MVTPLVGVWIEIVFGSALIPPRTSSLPLWECGLKSTMSEPVPSSTYVTPLVGVWIDIASLDCLRKSC